MGFLTSKSLTAEIDKQLIKKLYTAMPGKYITYVICATLSRWLAVAWFVFFAFYLGLSTYLQNRGMEIPEDVMKSGAQGVLICVGIYIVARMVSGGLYRELTRFLNVTWQNQS